MFSSFFLRCFNLQQCTIKCIKKLHKSKFNVEMSLEVNSMIIYYFFLIFSHFIFYCFPLGSHVNEKLQISHFTFVVFESFLFFLVWMGNLIEAPRSQTSPCGASRLASIQLQSNVTCVQMIHGRLEAALIPFQMSLNSLNGLPMSKRRREDFTSATFFNCLFFFFCLGADQ